MITINKLSQDIQFLNISTILHGGIVKALLSSPAATCMSTNLATHKNKALDGRELLLVLTHPFLCTDISTSWV